MRRDRDNKDPTMLLFKAYQAQGRRLSLYNATMLVVALAAIAAPVVVAVLAIEHGFAWPVVGGLVMVTFSGAAGLLLAAAKLTDSTARVVEVRNNSPALRLIWSLNRVEYHHAERAGGAAVSGVGEYIEPDGFDRDSVAGTPASARADTS